MTLSYRDKKPRDKRTGLIAIFVAASAGFGALLYFQHDSTSQAPLSIGATEKLDALLSAQLSPTDKTKLIGQEILTPPPADEVLTSATQTISVTPTDFYVERGQQCVTVNAKDSDKKVGFRNYCHKAFGL